MENNPNYFQEILSKNQYFLKEYTELNYNIRNNYLLFGFGITSNNKNIINEAYNKLNNDIQKLINHLNNFKQFFESLKINSDDLIYNEELLYKYFQENYNYKNFSSNFYNKINITNVSISLFILNSSKEYKAFFLEIIINKLVFSFKKIQKKYSINLKTEYNFENKIIMFLKQIKDNIDISSQKNIDIKFNWKKLSNTNNRISIEISISIGNLFIINIFFEIFEFIDYENKKKYITKKKLFLKGKKEIFPTNHHCLEIKKKSFVDSKFLLYKRLKNFLFEKLDFFLKTRENFFPELPLFEIYYFINYLSSYTKLFNEKCFLCHKTARYSLIDKVFYPPIFLVFPYLFFCHEECLDYLSNN